MNLKKNVGKISLGHNPFKPFNRKTNNSPNPIYCSTVNLNLNEVGIEMFFSYH